MRVLLVKTSSLGDVLHALPAVTDAANALPGVRFDWVVEEGFQEIPGWHPAVDQVIPVAVRRWRKNWLKTLAGPEWRQFKQAMQRHSYHAVIDAQGLLKSALLARKALGPRYGLDRDSAREPLASLTYDHPQRVAWDQHAIPRVRRLLAQSLGYAYPLSDPDYQIRGHFSPTADSEAPYLVFLHGTTWTTKHWPEEYWLQLAQIAATHGFPVKFPWGSKSEQARAERISNRVPEAQVLARSDLSGLADILAGARGYVGVDTGIGHLAAALGTPGISLYGATDPERTGTLGNKQIHLAADFECAPCLKRECRFPGEATVKPACYTSIPPDTVWQHLQQLLHPTD